MEGQEKKKRKLSTVLKDNFQKIIIFLVSALYIVQGLFDFKRRDTTIWEILGNAGISVLVGIIISSNLRSMGLRDGRASDIFVASSKLYSEAKEKATPYFNKLPAWCDYKNTKELELRKKEIIQSVGLNWKAYKYGYYDEHNEKLSEEQKNAVAKAKKCKVFRLTSQEILSDLPHYNGKNNKRFGDTEKEYKIKKTETDIVSKVFTALIFGLYTLDPILSAENAAELIAGLLWNATQIVLWFALGLIGYFNAKSFIENEYRQVRIIQKTELLNEFVITMEKDPGVIEVYDEEIEVDRFIEEFLILKRQGQEGYDA